MTKADLRKEPDPHDEEEELELPRDTELAGDVEVQETVAKVFEDIVKGLEAHAFRSDNAIANWEMYDCKLGPDQQYSGTHQIFVPLVHDAMEARKTRFTNQLFPRSGRFVDVISHDATMPNALLSLLDWYVRKAHIRTQVVPALVKAGDAEGQYNIYVSWVKNDRHVVWKETRPGATADEEIEIINEETVTHAYPQVEVLSDADVIVLPVTCNSLEDAIGQGGAVVILRRWTKTKIAQMVEDDEIEEEAGELLLSSMQQDMDNVSRGNPEKVHVDQAGIKKDGRGTYALVYEIWFKMLVKEGGKKEKRLCRAYTAGRDRLLSCRRNPYWSDKLPILSTPKDKQPSVYKGKPPVDFVKDFQIAANDAINMGMDSAQYALCPLTMTDPEKNPNIGSMIMSMSAIWMTSPNDTQFAQMPQIWKDAFEIVGATQRQIFQTLGVNPAQITQGAGPRKKLNQAEIALEQQVDLLTTADAVSILEQDILSPMLERFIELDHQFRDEELTVPSFGEMGVEARMERIPPIQFGRRYQFLWYGVEAAKNAQQVQQQIAGINVLRGIPPQMYKGFELNLVPVLVNFIENTFGPRLAPLVFKDVRKQLSADPQQENQWLTQGLEVSVHAMDNHQQHLQVHMEGIQKNGDPSGRARMHMFYHQQAIQEAMMAQMGPPPGQPGAPGGAGPGMPGQPPRVGAQPGQVRGGQNPPGAVHQDQMHGPGVMPRRAG